MYSEVILYLLLFVIALLYSSVGHGGASGYLALMIFFAGAPETMRPTALMLNIFVSLIAFTQYYRSGYFQWKLFYPFALASIPAAYLGGLISIDADLYKKILAVFLLFPIIKLFGFKFQTETISKEINFKLALIIGGIIGFFSGLIGIGGGIILSPIILLLHWADMKRTATVSALFIFVNSLAGFAGLFNNGFEFKIEMGWMIAIAICGGILGSYLGSKKFDTTFLKKILAVVLLIASIKLMLT